MRRLLSNQRGMTLAEVLVAMTIIALGLLALLSAIPIGSYAVQEGRQVSTATFLANQRLEQVNNAKWTVDPANLAGPPLQDDVGLSSSATAEPKSVKDAHVTFHDEAQVVDPTVNCITSPASCPYVSYSRQVRVTDCGVAPGCGGITSSRMRQVTVTVSYRPLTGGGVAAAGTTKSAVVTMTVSQR